MKNFIKIAVDAMGGDGSPKKIIDGIHLNHKFNKDTYFKIFGDKNKIDPTNVFLYLISIKYWNFSNIFLIINN